MANRRQALASLLVFAAFPAFAQQDRVWRIGFLATNRRPANLASHRFGAVLAGLRERGYVEGKNLTVDWRFADDVYGRLPALAAEIVQLKPDLIIATGTAATRVAQKAAKGIPIIALGAGDPVGSGLVESLSRPGRNTTGVSMMSADLGPKWLDLARELVPKLSKVGLLITIGNPAYTSTLEGVWNSARARNMVVFPTEVRSPSDFERAFDILGRESVGAVIVQNEGMFSDQSRRLAELATKARLPLITGRRDFVEAGCVMSYGTDLGRHYRRAAAQIDKIFKGANAGDLPVEQPVDYELWINAKAARAIGLTVPRDLLLRADKVIE